MRHFNSLALLVTALGLGLASTSAAADTYNLDGQGNSWSVPPGCTAKNNTDVTCDSDLQLNSDDVIITDGKFIIRVNGNVTLNNPIFQLVPPMND